MKAAVAGAAALCLVAGGLSKGCAAGPAAAFGPDPRAGIADFARARRLDPATLVRRYAATGIVHCGGAHGAGQLTLADDVVTTAAHVLYDRNGRRRADGAHCRFVVEAGGVEIATALAVEGAIVGSTDPYHDSPVRDWAVVKLARPLGEAEPYRLSPPARIARQAPALFVARGAIDWRGGRETSLQTCRLSEGIEDGAEGTREFAFDCAAGIGASGAGLFDGRGGGLMAIFVGFRTPAPGAPARDNFAVTVEGAFRRAVERMAALAATAAAK